MRHYHLGCFALQTGVSVEQVYAHSATLQRDWHEDGGPEPLCAYCGRPIPYGVAYTTEAFWLAVPVDVPARV